MTTTPSIPGTMAGYVTSTDGARISYLSIGHGPGVIVVPGALSTADDYLAFARHLADRYTVHIIERRGRGQSAPQGDDYSLATEREDVLALQKETNARYFVGHSFGGLVALEAARANPNLRKLAVYEPGVSIDGSIPMSWLPRYEEYLSQGKQLDAFVTFSCGTGPDRGRRTPRWLMKLLLPLVVKSDKRNKMFTLLRQNVLEHRAIGQAEGSWPGYAQITAPVLLMHGGKTGIGWVDLTIQRLSEVLPNSAIVKFDRLNHFGIDQGNPALVATNVADFFHSDVGDTDQQ
jgi:pimeloyl-ACP methyl ester carboxylesterase